MSIQIFAARTTNPASAIPRVLIPVSDDSRQISSWLGLDEHADINIHPETVIRSIYRARELGRDNDHFDAMYRLADQARDIGHLVDWVECFSGGRYVMVLQVSQYEIGEPSTFWSASDALAVFDDLDVPFSLSGTIDPDALIAKCDRALARGSVWFERIRNLRFIADWALARGRHVAWC